MSLRKNTPLKVRYLEKMGFSGGTTSEMAYGYDLGVIVGQTLNEVKGKLTKESIVEAFHKLQCFNGTTVGKMCFTPDGGHAERKITFVKFTKSGFVPVVKK